MAGMTLIEINRIEAMALVFVDSEIATTIALTPGQVIELCRLARASFDVAGNEPGGYDGA